MNLKAVRQVIALTAFYYGYQVIILWIDIVKNETIYNLIKIFH